MKQTAYIAGVGMTAFGNHQSRPLSSLAHEAINAALADAGLTIDQMQAAWSGNAAAPLITGQGCIAGQAILRKLGAGGIPVANVENACATASTAFQQACSMVTLGAYDIVLAFGVEKLYHTDKARIFSVFDGCVDVEQPDALRQFLGEDAPEAGARSIFMDIYARWARDYMRESGATPVHYAKVSAKNSFHGSLNPLAQFRNVMSPEEVLAAPMVCDPLTRVMCSPLGDGAAAAVIVSEAAMRRLGLGRSVRVLSSVLASGPVGGSESCVELTAKRAYENAGLGPEDLHCVELHDASSPAEMMYYEDLGICPVGGGPELVETGATRLGGRLPVNTSGGLVRKGHPIGATGLSQIYELTSQLRGEAGGRQVAGAKVALAENGGGFLDGDAAAMVISVLSI